MPVLSQDIQMRFCIMCSLSIISVNTVNKRANQRIPVHIRVNGWYCRSGYWQPELRSVHIYIFLTNKKGVNMDITGGVSLILTENIIAKTVHFSGKKRAWWGRRRIEMGQVGGSVATYKRLYIYTRVLALYGSWYFDQ